MKNIDLEYKTKTDGTVVPICEVEVEIPYNGIFDIVKVTAFYDKAEHVASTISEGDWVGVRGRIKGTKGNDKYSIDLYAGMIEKAKESTIKNSL